MSYDTEQFSLFPAQTRAKEPSRATPKSLAVAGDKSRHITHSAPQETQRQVKAAPSEAEASPRFISVGEVAQRYSVSVPTIWRWLKIDKFPQPYRFGSGTTRWAITDLDAHDPLRAQERKQ